MAEIPETLTRSYCPEHGDVTGATFWGRGVAAIGQDNPECEWCRCGSPVQRVTFRVELQPNAEAL